MVNILLRWKTVFLSGFELEAVAGKMDEILGKAESSADILMTLSLLNPSDHLKKMSGKNVVNNND